MEELARRAREGDQAALDGLLRRIQPDVLRRCARFLPYRQDAEEACQDALLRVARNIGSFKGNSLFTTWLYTVVSNSARQTYRSMKRRSAEMPTEADRIPHQRDPRTTSVIAGSRIDLLEALDRLEQERPNLVAPLVLRDLCQMDYNEIAEELELALGTVKSRIHEGRKHVRKSLTVS
ncbi:RNA polymerase sigma factor [Murinocardiopsis flavida]|uniref:RNA polymerase sigma factor n=1 Tax=Murinocardiopsis flavida TaxID=645275 RepID=UPI000D0E0244|nr:sigma-70 family RNA polymerase sigma factor [Murinocardiopsis flavida]